jgi:hypothetical protein|tara:strand:+ start:768 stop:959 length:192 start_codon:yes stop_codon:yes gene_type:complete
MTITYKLYPDDENGSPKQAIQKTDEGVISSIPFDENNTDYQEYLKWLNGEDPYTEKGTPDPAD